MGGEWYPLVAEHPALVPRVGKCGAEMRAGRFVAQWTPPAARRPTSGLATYAADSVGESRIPLCPLYRMRSDSLHARLCPLCSHLSPVSDP